MSSIIYNDTVAIQGKVKILLGGIPQKKITLHDSVKFRRRQYRLDKRISH